MKKALLAVASKGCYAECSPRERKRRGWVALLLGTTDYTRVVTIAITRVRVMTDTRKRVQARRAAGWERT